MFSKTAAVTAAGVLAVSGLATGTAHATATPPASPTVTATPACGKVTISAGNPTRHANARLQYQVDHQPVRTVILAASGVTAVPPILFREDSGVHLVRWRLWGGPERDWDKPSWNSGPYSDFDPRGFGGRWADTIRVESDCRPNWAKPRTPIVKQPRCRSERGTLVIPAVRGVIYKVNGRPWRPGEHQVQPGPYLITAYAVDGFRLIGGHVWNEFIGRGHGCSGGHTREATPAAPTLTQASCDAPAALQIPEAEGVVYKNATGAELAQGTSYTVDPGRLVVTADAAEGFDLAEDAEAEWSFTVAPTPDCPASKPVPGVVVVNDVPVPSRVDTGLGGLARR